jgi:apolipoprotein N-acyltransferase
VAFRPDIVITEKGVSDLAQHYFLKAGITAFRRLRKTDQNRVARATGELLGCVSAFVRGVAVCGTVWCVVVCVQCAVCCAVLCWVPVLCAAYCVQCAVCVYLCGVWRCVVCSERIMYHW